jgi:hypothetical protein
LGYGLGYQGWVFTTSAVFTYKPVKDDLIRYDFFYLGFLEDVTYSFPVAGHIDLFVGGEAGLLYLRQMFDFGVVRKSFGGQFGVLVGIEIPIYGDLDFIVKSVLGLRTFRLNGQSKVSLLINAAIGMGYRF